MKLSPHDSSLDALKFVVDMADVPMVITDEDGRFVFANGHTLDIVGKAEDACINHSRPSYPFPGAHGSTGAARPLYCSRGKGVFMKSMVSAGFIPNRVCSSCPGFMT